MGSETRQKTVTTTIRLTPDERAAVAAAADAQGLGPSSFARVATLRAAGRTPPAIRKRRDAVAGVIGPVLGELGRIGSNINQIARVANSTKNATAIVAAGCLRADLEKLTTAVLALKGSSG
ncbi:MobC family plasmid mobilization relaxosome protein [Rhodopseudomonas sp. BR0G17]|uniref:MobC family plasmid mobilization relaxosome protein n=1 Tax=Rhodopseudomonas sp. BR0G17 TaxID=2269368 RepID=UPI0013DF60D9|nr:MobC family plasmid mobilization relaxosome protein [Rhodopseudomonas sp. BR0G17]